MSEASLAAQRLAVTTLRSDTGFNALVDENIFDRNARPEVFPCVLLGEAQVVADEADCVIGSEVFLTIHVWTRENTFTDCKTICGDIRRLLRGLSGVQEGFALDFNFESANYLRDPGGEHSHGILTFNVLAEDTVGVI